MTDITLHLFIGADWVRCKKIVETPNLQASTVPLKGQALEIRENGQLIIAYVVHDVRHVFADGQHEVQVLFFEAAPSIYEGLGIRTV